MGIAIAIGGSAVIGGVAQSNAAGQAASAQEKAAAQANATQQGFFNTTQQNLQPFIQTGVGAGNQIAGLEGFGPNGSTGIQSTLESLPGYQFANTQGLKSVQNQATERGLGLSGAALKGASNYSTGLANQYYNNLLSGLQTTQQTGENAAAGLGSAATQTGGNIAQTTVGAGQAQAASDIAQGAAISNAAGGLPSGLLTSQLLQNQSNLANSISGIYNSGDDYAGQNALYQGLGY